MKQPPLSVGNYLCTIVTMNWSDYKCNPTPRNLNDVARYRLKEPRCLDPKGFVFVKNDSNFDLTRYGGNFPALVVLNDDTVIGWAADNRPRSYKELEPWKTNPPPLFYWEQPSRSVHLTYRHAVKILRQHCQDLKDLRVGVPNQTEFEQGRQILWSLALSDNCLNLQKVVDMEVTYMKSIVANDASILRRCVKFHNLEMPTVDCLETHIRNQYAKSSTTDSVHGDFFKMLSSTVAGMLSI